MELNKNIKEATNAIYSINGNEESSYSNTFSVHGAYHVTLHPEYTGTGMTMSDQITARAAAATTGKTATATIGLYPDAESLAMVSLHIIIIKHSCVNTGHIWIWIACIGIGICTDASVNILHWVE